MKAIMNLQVGVVFKDEFAFITRELSSTSYKIFQELKNIF